MVTVSVVAFAPTFAHVKEVADNETCMAPPHTRLADTSGSFGRTVTMPEPSRLTEMF